MKNFLAMLFVSFAAHFAIISAVVAQDEAPVMREHKGDLPIFATVMSSSCLMAEVKDDGVTIDWDCVERSARIGQVYLRSLATVLLQARRDGSKIHIKGASQ
jgi:hypothetical protein